ncbi:MAG TPA: protein phosphatase 2C domain-containing protein [bacterium]|nr:protein phosphatase 2C domain-containing protein [bacterium]
MKQVPRAPVRPTESLSLEVGSATDPGRVRPKNEDYVRYEVPTDPLLHASRGSLFIVADGVGGAGGGAVASAEAAHTVAQEYYLNLRGDPGRILRRAIEQANLHVYHLREGHPALSGMQTTLTSLVVRGGRYWLGHVGDSKAFLVRGGAVRQLTRDHTIVQEMRRLGLVDAPGADRHPHRHLLTRTIGGDILVAVDLRSGPAQRGDCFILATDGVLEHLTPEDVRATFTNFPPDAAAAACVREANRRGGFDNLTVLAIRITG